MPRGRDRGRDDHSAQLLRSMISITPVITAIHSNGTHTSSRKIGPSGRCSSPFKETDAPSPVGCPSGPLPQECRATPLVQ